MSSESAGRCDFEATGRCSDGLCELRCRRAGCGRRFWSRHDAGRTYAACRAGESQEMPGIGRQAGTLARTMGAWVRRGGRRASGAVREARLAICDECPAMVTSKAGPRCRVCGCMLRAKAAVVVGEDGRDCPKGYWPAVEEG